MANIRAGQMLIRHGFALRGVAVCALTHALIMTPKEGGRISRKLLEIHIEQAWEGLSDTFSSGCRKQSLLSNSGLARFKVIGLRREQ